MNNSYIKNKGTTTLISSIPGENCISGDEYNKVDWDIEYDGNVANINLDVNSNGESKHINYELTNSDLADILNVPSFDMPLEKRLSLDFPLERESLSRKNENIFLVPNQNMVLTDKNYKKKIDQLIQPFQVKKLTSRVRRPKIHTNKFSSLKRKLITPRPKTIRIHLRPKTKSTTSSKRKM